MAEIRLSYIIIEKQKHESKQIKDILLEIIDGVVDARNDEVIKIGSVNVIYRIIQQRNSKQCFLEMSSKARVNQGIAALQRIDNALFKSNQQKYYLIIRDYDGISESFCTRLYPKYAEFERKLRSLVLFILTKAYGINWRAETVSEETLVVLQEKAHGRVSLNETLENMDFAMLESYLFDKRPVDYFAILNGKLSKDNLSKMSKDEICEIIEMMRPVSLWEMHFEKFGSQENWKKKIADIHLTRNKVAHQKTISIDEYKDVNKKLNKINRLLSEAIEGIREENFTEYSAIDILGSFALKVGTAIKQIVDSQAFRDVIIGFSEKIQEIVKPMTQHYVSEIAESLKSVATTYDAFNFGPAQSQMVQCMKALTEGLAITDKDMKYMQSALVTANKDFEMYQAITQSEAMKANLVGALNVPQMEKLSTIVEKQERLGNPFPQLFEIVEDEEDEPSDE